MKLIKLLALTIALFLFSHCGYAQFGNLTNKIKNKVENKLKSKSEKTETTAGKDAQTDNPAASTTTKEDNNLMAKTVSNESNTVIKKYVLYDDLKHIPGATFYFSDKPFGSSHEDAKTTFKSNDFIYARLELNNQTMEEAFKLYPDDYKYYYLMYDFAVVSGSEGKYAQTFHSAMMLQPDDIKKTAFNFDLLPEPAKATTGIGMKSSYNFNGFEFSHVVGGPMYEIIDQSNFPANGDYTVQLQFYFMPKDDWGKALSNSKDFLGVDGAFQFNFSATDVAVIKKNAKAVDETVKTTAFTLHAMPDWWPKTSVRLSDPALSPSALESMIKNALSAQNKVLVKYAVGSNSGWDIQKNDLGIPTYQLLAENIYTVYKKEGKCYLGDVSIAKEYLGGGKYGKPYVRNVNVATSGYGTIIDCSAIK